MNGASGPAVVFVGLVFARGLLVGGGNEKMKCLLRRSNVVGGSKVHEHSELGHGVSDLGDTHGVFGYSCGFDRCGGHELGVDGHGVVDRVDGVHRQRHGVVEERRLDPLDAKLAAHHDLGGALDGEYRPVAVGVDHGQAGHHPNQAQVEHLELETGQLQRELLDETGLVGTAGQRAFVEAGGQETWEHRSGEIHTTAEQPEHRSGACGLLLLRG